MTQEKVLVVPASCLWKRIAYTPKGVITDGVHELAPLIGGCGRFVDRSQAENDPVYKQIIPYAVVHHADSFFLLERKTAQNEQRLHNKLSIGVGGHINGNYILDSLAGVMYTLNMETNNSKEYEEALKISDSAIKAFGLIKAAYRAGTIGDAEFLAGRKAYDAAMADYDAAYAKEAN